MSAQPDTVAPQSETAAPVKAIAIYCGENTEMTDENKLAAEILGKALAERGIAIIYGGSQQGLMGIVADAALAAGGTVIGVIPKDFSKHRWHEGLTQTIIVENLDERNQVMTNLSNGCIALPGGHGTMFEFEREVTLHKLAVKNGGESDRRIVTFAPDDFFNYYIKFVSEMGRIKGNRKDGELFANVKSVDLALVALGVMSKQEYDKKYEIAPADQILFSPGYIVTSQDMKDYSEPITDKQYKRDMFTACSLLIAGAGLMVLAGCGILTLPVGAVAGAFGFFAFLAGIELSSLTDSRRRATLALLSKKEPEPVAG